MLQNGNLFGVVFSMLSMFHTKQCSINKMKIEVKKKKMIK